MKLTSILEAADNTRPGDVYQNKRTGEIFLVLAPFQSDFGRKWDGVEFNLKHKSGPFVSGWCSHNPCGTQSFRGI